MKKKYRICVISDALEYPFDEGVKNFVYNFIKSLEKNNKVLSIGKKKSIDSTKRLMWVDGIPGNKLYISNYMRKRIKNFNPDIIFYIPIACATVFSFLRAKIIKSYCMRSQLIMISLQPRSYNSIKKKIIRYLNVDFILAQSVESVNQLLNIGCNAALVGIGVDQQKFKPVGMNTKNRLRKKYSFSRKKYLILHVGHINENRNIKIFSEIQKLKDVQTVIIGSSSTFKDNILMEKLRSDGVIIMDQTINEIEEIYQCCDCYLFPVISKTGCIEIPLSIFEAIACNMPVVTTRFGPLEKMIPQRVDFRYSNNKNEIVKNIEEIKKIKKIDTKSIAKKYTWDNVAEKAISIVIDGTN